jgi:hypothetical protein
MMIAYDIQAHDIFAPGGWARVGGASARGWRVRQEDDLAACVGEGVGEGGRDIFSAVLTRDVRGALCETDRHRAETWARGVRVVPHLDHSLSLGPSHLTNRPA